MNCVPVGVSVSRCVNCKYFRKVGVACRRYQVRISFLFLVLPADTEVGGWMTVHLWFCVRRQPKNQRLTHESPAAHGKRLTRLGGLACPSNKCASETCVPVLARVGQLDSENWKVYYSLNNHIRTSLCLLTLKSDIALPLSLITTHVTNCFFYMFVSAKSVNIRYDMFQYKVFVILLDLCFFL